MYVINMWVYMYKYFTHTRTHARTHAHTHTHTHHMDKWTNVKPSTSFDVNLEVSCGDSSPASIDRASMRYVESWGQRYNPSGASSRGTENGAALGLDTKTHKYPSAA